MGLNYKLSYMFWFLTNISGSFSVQLYVTCSDLQCTMLIGSTMYAISDCIAFARNWSSPSNYVYELLQSSMFPSEFGLSATFRLSGILTVFAFVKPSLCKIALIYHFYKSVMKSLVHVISMPMIFTSSLRSVISHLACKLFAIFVKIDSDMANKRRLLTYMVIISYLFPLCQIDLSIAIGTCVIAVWY